MNRRQDRQFIRLVYLAFLKSRMGGVVGIKSVKEVEDDGKRSGRFGG